MLELSNSVAGACASEPLADQGASVIKIEPPQEGDFARHEPPFLSPDPEQSSLFLATNTHKRGITLDSETKVGRELLLKLVQNTDPVIETFTPSYLEKLGADFRDLIEINPKLVMTSVTYFGQTGPYAKWHGDELTMEALGGFLYTVTGFNDHAPRGTALYQMELKAGRNAANATAVALMQQQMGGVPGQHVDVSIYASTVSVQPSITAYSFNDTVGRRAGADTMVLDGMHLKTKDGEVTLATAGTAGKPMETWAEFLGTPEVLDPRFKTRERRRTLWKQQFDVVQEKLLNWTNDDLIRETTKKGLVIDLVLSTFRVVESEHLKACKFWVEIHHPTTGTFKYPGPSFQLDVENPLSDNTPAPLLGPHNAKVYCRQLGMSMEGPGYHRRFRCRIGPGSTRPGAPVTRILNRPLRYSGGACISVC